MKHSRWLKRLERAQQVGSEGPGVHQAFPTPHILCGKWRRHAWGGQVAALQFRQLGQRNVMPNMLHYSQGAQ